MCSISGILDFNNKIDESVLRQFLKAMVHRGPDDRGTFVDGPIGFAHTRLSILDLSSAGHQPMVSNSGRFIICFNGEIYNHLELRKRYLPSHPFRSTCDTETLVELFSLFMLSNKALTSFFSELNGMFAISLWDKQEKKLFLARDRMGIKPLYIYRKPGFFAFSSEIKAFKAAGLDLPVSPVGVQNYFVYGHSSLPSTIYSTVDKLRPATVLSINSHEEKTEKYWSIYASVFKKHPESYESAKTQLTALLTDSVRSHLISDVPFGAFLSGGLDSSAIVAMMQKLHGAAINTFSVAFNMGNNARHGKYSELNEAALVAKQIGSTHHEIFPTVFDLKNCIEKVVYSYDEPFGDPAAFPTYIVSEFARKYVTVCLTGEGADELFGGYRRYSAELWREKHRFLSRLFSAGFPMLAPCIPRARRLNKIAKAFGDTTPSSRYSRWLETLDDHDYLSLTGSAISRNKDYGLIFKEVGGDLSKFIFLADQLTLLVDGYLEKVDKASMAHSLEARVPFLDFRIVEFANSLPMHWKIGATTKQILKDCMRGVLPDQILDKPKHGFAVPIDEWLRRELKEYFKERLFGSGFSFDTFGLNKKFVERAFLDHCAMRRDYSFFLWHMLMFAVWAQSEGNKT
jgi:asparagine synthase (glutamine-hydrolysing)